jgi:hypothetical protein
MTLMTPVEEKLFAILARTAKLGLCVYLSLVISVMYECKGLSDMRLRNDGILRIHVTVSHRFQALPSESFGMKNPIGRLLVVRFSCANCGADS